MTIHEMLNTTALSSPRELKDLYTREMTILESAAPVTAAEQQLLEKKRIALKNEYELSALQGQADTEQKLLDKYTSPVEPTRLNSCTIPSISWLGMTLLNKTCGCTLDYWNKGFLCCHIFDTVMAVAGIGWILFEVYDPVSDFISNMRFARYRKKVRKLFDRKDIFYSLPKDVSDFFKLLDRYGQKVPEYTETILNQAAQINAEIEIEHNQFMKQRLKLKKSSCFKRLAMDNKDLAHFLNGGRES